MSKLLGVDDVANIRLLYSVELAEEGYVVETAATIAVAGEKLVQQVFGEVTELVPILMFVLTVQHKTVQQFAV